MTSDFVYIRFHGLGDGPRQDYTECELEPWARHFYEQAKAEKKAFVYFNNDLNVRALGNFWVTMCKVR